MKESIFQFELKGTFQDLGCWTLKIPDMIKTKETRFIPKKPADLIVICGLVPLLIECKQIKKWQKINPNYFGNTKEKLLKVPFTEYHQIKELVKFKEVAGGLAYYAINIRIKEEKINKCIFIHIDTMLNILKKGGISKDQLKTMASHGYQGKLRRFNTERFRKHFQLGEFKK